MPVSVAISLSELLEQRAEELEDWLDDNAPDVGKEQRHLDEGTTERSYWHHGYAAALRDVLRLLTIGNYPKM